MNEVKSNDITIRRALEQFCELHSGKITIPDKPYSKAHLIIELLRDGEKTETIARKLKTQPVYVERVVKKFLETKVIPD